MSLPTIAIVGRANVGKSTLFNRLIEKEQALVSPIAGTTRDISYGIAWWEGLPYQIIDTGGLDIKRPANSIEAGIVKQANKAVKQADLIIFLTDAKTGVLPGDQLVAQKIIQLKTPKLLVANKADSSRWRQISKELFSLGLGEPHFVSAANGSGVGDLLEIITKLLPTPTIPPLDPATIKLAIFGKPNVGKSSLLNSILGEERVIVSEIPHTTREAQFVDFSLEQYHFTLIDTAGIRKKAKIERGLEKLSVTKSLVAIQLAEIVLLITDIAEQLSTQDRHLTEEIAKNNSSVVLVVNKWDLATTKGQEMQQKVVKYYRNNFPYLAWAPIIFVSAKTGLNVKKILPLVIEVYQQRHRQLSQGELDKFLNGAMRKHRPSKEARRPLQRGGSRPTKLMVYQLTQTGVNPPRFELLINNDELIHFSFLRWLQNQLRNYFKITGTPIMLHTKMLKEKNKE